MRGYALWDRTVCLLFPPRCVLCGAVVHYEDRFCEQCTVAVQAMALPAHAALAGVLSPFVYDGGARHAVHTIKEYRDRRTLQFFADHMQALLTEQWGGAFDLAVPVPATRSSRRARGFKQAQALAEALAERLRIPCEANVLRRLSRSRTQHTLSAKERLDNAEFSYALRDGAPVRKKRVLLVDDVYTTGATLQACAALLAGAGARVHGVTATYTAKPAERHSGAGGAGDFDW